AGREKNERIADGRRISPPEHRHEQQIEQYLQRHISHDGEECDVMQELFFSTSSSWRRSPSVSRRAISGTERPRALPAAAKGAMLPHGRPRFVGPTAMRVGLPP